MADDGSGVSKIDLEGLALKHHTSKFSNITDLQVCVKWASHRVASNSMCNTHNEQIITPADLQTLASFGFRGEALSSLCAVSELMVTTRTAGDVTGSRVTYDSAGQISSQVSIARSKGTTVALRELFKPLPVRRKVDTSSSPCNTSSDPSSPGFDLCSGRMLHSMAPSPCAAAHRSCFGM